MDQGIDGYGIERSRTGSGREPSSEEMDAIRADIQATRARMSRTVEDIGERLNPDRVKDQLKQNLHDATIGKAEHMARAAVDRVDDTRHNIMDSIRENPIPSAMVGIGLGWLLLNARRDGHGHGHGYSEGRRSGSTTRYGSDVMNAGYYRPVHSESDGAERSGGRVSELRETASELRSNAVERGEELTHRLHDRATGIAHDANDAITDMADRAQEMIGNTASQARSMAGDFAEQTRHRAHRVEDRFEDVLHDSPLAVGADAVALGLAVGLSAPSTRRESELMGAARDDLLHRAKDVVTDVGERVQKVATRVADEAATSFQESARDEGLS